MLRYEYRFTGLWLGGKVITLAADGDTALAMTTKRVRDEGFDPQTLRLDSVRKIDTSEIVYFDDGNY
jgi:hypothetical protein